MGDIDDIEDVEGDRNADRHSRIEAAEQKAGNDGVDQQFQAVAPPDAADFGLF